MATIRKRSASFTLAEGGQDSEDISVRGAGSTDRFSGLFGVRVTHDEASPSFSVVVYEIDDIDEDDDDTYGRRVFGVNEPVSGQMYYPRVDSVDENGDSTSEENGIAFIGTQEVRVDAEGGTDAGTVTVDLYIQTAGDQRF